MIFTVAIDDPAAAGKGTLARAVAAHFAFAYLDTGLLHRAAARKAMHGLDPVAVGQGGREVLSGPGCDRGAVAVQRNVEANP